MTLAAVDLDAQRDFYGRVLGLPELDGGTFAAGETHLDFRVAEPGTEPTYHLAFGVPSNLFSEAKEWVAERAELLHLDGDDEIFFDFWNAHSCYFRDPAGSVLELIAHHEEPVERAAPFAAEHFVGVAEVGLPVPDPHAAVAALRDRLGLDVWDGRGVRPDRITPVGSRHAGFIVVRTGRRWFPTDLPAGLHPFEALVAGPREGAWEPEGLPYVVRSKPD